MNSQRDNLVALIPVYNAAGHVGKVVRRTLPRVGRVLVVDDGSTDGSGDEAREAGAEVIRHAINRGKGAALRTGLARCRELGCEWIVLLDADGQHDADDIPRLLAEGERGAKFVLGNRMTRTANMPFSHRVGNRLSSWIVGRLCGQLLPDSQCGFRLIHRSLLDALVLTADYYEVDSEMLILASRAGCRVASVPVATIYADEHSNIRPMKDALRVLRLLLRYWHGH
ncbi:MAG: glycosyltransferase family 2 protein [Verrucomicrobia bacterium]|nr:glycosyltransferase family 2 protein [Verrucomicrobiota bacterium]